MLSTALLFFGGLIFVAGLAAIIANLFRREPLKQPLKTLGLGLIVFAIGIGLTPTDDNDEPDTAEPPAIQAEAETQQPAPEPKPDPEPEPEPVFDPTLYQNGITYDNLARNPDKYLYNLVAFNGEVVQVIEGDGIVQCRFAIDGDYDRMILIEYDPIILDSRVLEGDYMTIYGMSSGIYTYQSTMGGPISVPGVLVTTIKYS